MEQQATKATMSTNSEEDQQFPDLGPEHPSRKVSEALRRLIGHTILLDALAHRLGDPPREKLLDALDGAHSGAQEIQSVLKKAVSRLPGPEASPEAMPEDLGLILGLILHHSDEIPQEIVDLARDISLKHGYDPTAIE